MAAILSLPQCVDIVCLLDYHLEGNKLMANIRDRWYNRISLIKIMDIIDAVDQNDE